MFPSKEVSGIDNTSGYVKQILKKNKLNFQKKNKKTKIKQNITIFSQQFMNNKAPSWFMK